MLVPEATIMNNLSRRLAAYDRRRFLSSVGKGVGLAALSSATVAALLKDVAAATASIGHLPPAEVARVY